MAQKANELLGNVVDTEKSSNENSLPLVSAKNTVSLRERMRSKLNSDKYSEETKAEVKRLVGNAVKFLLNREARALPKAAKIRYLVNVQHYPRKLLNYPDIADALDLPVLPKQLPKTPPTPTIQKKEEEKGTCLDIFLLACA